MCYSGPSRDWYEPEGCDISKECPSCEENHQRMDNAADVLQLIVKQLYTKDPLNVVKLEDLIDELCFFLKVEKKENELQIERTKNIQKSAHKSLLEIYEWKTLNNQYLKHLTHTIKEPLYEHSIFT